MTLDEAIKHAEEVAEENNKCAEHIRDKMKSEIALSNATECETCADEHRQLAEWLKDYKRLLEQPTSDNCVSREKVSYMITGGKYANEDYEQFIDRLVKELESLPPVTPTRKVGKWIYDKAIQNWRCSVCNKTPKTMGFCGTSDFMEKEFTFCNHCGAEMRGSESG